MLNNKLTVVMYNHRNLYNISFGGNSKSDENNDKSFPFQNPIKSKNKRDVGTVSNISLFKIGRAHV